MRENRLIPEDDYVELQQTKRNVLQNGDGEQDPNSQYFQRRVNFGQVLNTDEDVDEEKKRFDEDGSLLESLDQRMSSHNSN